MQTRSSLQKSASEQSNDRLVASIKPRDWGNSLHESSTQPTTAGHDFSHVNLFAHDPGVRSVPRGIQAKLTVGAPNDQYEQEADRVAAQVMSMPDPASGVQRDMAAEQEDEAIQTKPLAATITPVVQREAMPEEEEPIQGKFLQREAMPEEEEPIQGKFLQREAMPEEEEPIQGKFLQREAMPEEEELAQTKPVVQRSTNGSFITENTLENRLNNSKGQGNPLPDDVRSFMEPRFGADFSQVRVHTGGEAVQMNQELGAQAFTHGSHVYYGAGKAPAKDELTGHELTHVLQQTSHRKLQTKTPDIQPYKTSAGFFSDKVEFESSGFGGTLAGGLDITKTGSDLSIASQAYTARGTVQASGPAGRVKEFEVGFLQTVYDSRRNFYYQPDPYSPNLITRIGTAIAPQLFSNRLKSTDLCDPLPVRDGDAGILPWYGLETVSAFDNAPVSTKVASMYDKPSSSSEWTKTVGSTTQYLVKTDGQDIFRSWLSVQEKGTTGFWGMHRLGYIDWKVDYGTTVTVNKANPAASVVTPTAGSGGRIIGTSEGFGALIPLMGDPVANDAAKIVESNW